MALLEQIESHRRCALSARVLVGRSRRCDLRLDTPRSSSEHAVIVWHQAAWWLRDLGSRNGTQLNDEAVSAQQVVLSAGDTVCFGDSSGSWRVVSVAPPGAVVWQSDAVRHTQDGLLTDDPDAPTWSIFSAADGRWLIEQDGVPRFLKDGEQLIDGAQIYLPVGETTRPATTIGQTRSSSAQVTLTFQVSQDEEYVELALEHGTRRQALHPRAFHYLLLILARERLRDIDAGQPTAEQGWIHIEDLCRLAQTEPSRINVDVYRARRQLADAGIADAGQLVERRTTSRQLRLGFAHCRVCRL